MGELVIHFGINPSSLVTILRAFSNHGEHEIHLVDDDDLNDENTTFFWSNLKLQKRYWVTDEFGFERKFEEVKIKSVIDITNFQKLKNKIILDRQVHFILSQTTVEVDNCFQLIYEILSSRKKINSKQPTLIYLVNNYRTSEFMRRFRIFCNQSSLEYDYKWNHSFFIECVTDVLCRISPKNDDRCVVFCEKDDGIFYINKEDFLIPPFSFLKGMQNYLNHDLLNSLNKKVLVKDIEKLRRVILIRTIYKYLLSVFTIDAGHWFITGYFKFHNTDARYVCDSLKSELSQEFGNVSFLKAFDLRLINEDVNAIYTLGIGDIKKIQQVYFSLLDAFTKSKRTNFISDKSSLVGYALDILSKEIDSML